MKLLRLQLKRFKRFADFGCEFAPGINVVKGPRNEIGKSTLVDGLCTALLGNPSSTAKSLDGYTSWGVNQQRCEAVLEFEENGICYRLEKDFERKRIALTNLASGETSDTPREVEQALKRLLGQFSEKLFFATCCIRQSEVARIDSGKEKISESLERVVTGGSEDILVSKINRDLNRAISALTSTGAKNPGKIVRYESDLERLERELASLRERVEKVEKARLELVTLKQELSGIEGPLKLKKELLEKNKQRLQVEQNIATYKQEYHRLEETLEGARKILKEIEDGEREREGIIQKLSAVSGFNGIQAVAEVRNKLSEIGISRKNIHSDLQKRTQEIAPLSQEIESKKFTKALNSRILLIAGLILTALGAIGLVFSIASIGGVVLGLLMVIAHMWAKSVLSRLKTEHDGLVERIDTMEKALEKLDTEEKETLGKIGCNSFDEFTARDAEYERLFKARDQIERKLEGYRNQLLGKIGNRRVGDIENESRDVRLNLLLEQDKLTEDLRSSALLDGERYVALQSEVTALDASAAELTEKMKRCIWTIESAEQTPEDVIALEEKIENLREMLGREQDKHRIYQLVGDFVNRARDETLRSAREVLESEVQRHFSTFTCGKYTRVKLISELQFQIYSNEKGDWVHPEELSGGAIDQFYLACRIALVRLLYGDSRPPLILDDPFVNFDAARLRETLNYLKGLSLDYQIILPTLVDTYDEVADKVILLA